jgi:hypothetical protein
MKQNKKPQKPRNEFQEEAYPGFNIHVGGEELI